jgi:hypothetical protein
MVRLATDEQDWRGSQQDSRKARQTPVPSQQRAKLRRRVKRTSYPLPSVCHCSTSWLRHSKPSSCPQDQSQSEYRFSALDFFDPSLWIFARCGGGWKALVFDAKTGGKRSKTAFFRPKMRQNRPFFGCLLASNDSIKY